MELLLSANGYTYDAAAEGALEQLYEAAYRSGILKREEASPTSLITLGRSGKIPTTSVRRRISLFCRS